VLNIVSDSKECVEPTPYMRSRHMNLLDDWRQEAVRDGDRIYVGLGGVKYEKNLSGTCILSCHSNREVFCDRCHEYVGVRPYCWDCHAPTDQAQ
jgi:formate-dependent nitrite reductase cytochrome c552 subunit